MSKKSPKSRKQAAEDSREKLLQAGLELLGSNLGSPFDNIRSTEVARHAGFTPGAFYHHWPSQDDYREDLRRYVGGQQEADRSLERLGANLLGDANQGIVHALQAALRSELEELANDPSWHIQLAMLASHVQADLDRSGAQYQVWFDEFATFYGQLFELVGVELRPGRSLHWFVRSMAALNEGFGLQMRSGLSAGVDGLDDGWQAYDYAVATFVSAVTRRVDGAAITADSVAGKIAQLTA